MDKTLNAIIRDRHNCVVYKGIVQSSITSVLGYFSGAHPFLGRQRRPYIVFRNWFLYGFMFVYIYVYICQDGGAVGFVDFTKLLFALSSLAQPLKRVRSISEHFFIILSQRKACAGRFREETAGKRTGLITRWPLRRLLFTRLEIVFVTISAFAKRTKAAQKVFQEG